MLPKTLRKQGSHMLYPIILVFLFKRRRLRIGWLIRRTRFQNSQQGCRRGPREYREPYGVRDWKCGRAGRPRLLETTGIGHPEGQDGRDRPFKA